MIDETMLTDRLPREPDLSEPDVEIQEAPPSLTFGRLLAYPFNAAGLCIMGVYVLLPFVLWMVLMIMPTALKIAGGFLLLLINILITLSTIWYLTVCIRASAEGQIRAPDVFEYAQDDSPWEWLREFFFILMTVLMCIGPAFALRWFLDIRPVPFFAVLAAGAFFLPMMLLAVVLFDTIGALNPVLIIGSVFSTFLPYCGIVLLFMIPLALVVGINIVGLLSPDPLLELLVKAVGLYLFMLDACLLGRFFYNNEEKLRWDV